MITKSTPNGTKIWYDVFGFGHIYKWESEEREIVICQFDCGFRTIKRKELTEVIEEESYHEQSHGPQQYNFIIL